MNLSVQQQLLVRHPRSPILTREHWPYPVNIEDADGQC